MHASADRFSIATMNQLCKVCGEPAAGFHFGAFTCEGCKSFFGRTYNNLSQVHECKNGGQCVINKQNRTSCKACRLRKCIMVGMSKSGSRYGRRSNWFKIHCLLQEQAAFNGQTPALRSPITPTLQDGSLPFVSAHLRDSMGRDGPVRAAPQLQGPPELHSQDLQTSLSGLTTASQLNAQVERRLQEEALSALTRGQGHHPPSPDFESHYREQVLEALRRSQNLGSLRRTPDFDALRRSVEIDPLRRSHDLDALDALRQVAPEVEARLGPLAVLEWERRIREISRRSDTEVTLERKDQLSTEIKVEQLRSPADCCMESASGGAKGSHQSEHEAVSSVKEETLKPEYEQTELALSVHGDVEKSRREAPPKFASEKKGVGILMSEEERLSFLKAVNSQTSVYTRDQAPVTSTARMPTNADLLYNSLNNNIFPFPPYPPLWPSMLPFPPLAKFYPSFGGSLPPSAIDGFKSTMYSPLDATSSRSPLRLPKDDAMTKKRFLDAVLQVQRQDSNPLDGGAAGRGLSQAQPSVSPAASPPAPPVTSAAASHDQPMDLTVRRKRKMDKSEIIYNPSDDIADVVESEDEKADEKWLKRTDEEEEPVEEDEEAKANDMIESETQMKPTKTEVPLKLIKLDSPGETLVA
ncbi:uncharacterized protein LOC134763687 [Penaeus indicus]|uniref:uncharacterized protein LOC134763687 n=1 Tax=Penaeus indicus TaxID=29960 RepID=UPI00300CA4B2